jgi:hypothetical protein
LHRIEGAPKMKPTGDPAIAAAIEYERAALNALQALEGIGRTEKQGACLRFVKASAAMRALSLTERKRAADYIAARGMIPSGAVPTIHAAIEALSRD